MAAIVVILVLYALLEWRDYLGTQRSRYRQSLGQMARLQQQQRPDLWAMRASDAQAELLTARSALWRNVSAGQAQAEVRDWLTSLLRQADAKGSSVRVTEPEAAIDAASVQDRLPESLKSLRPLRARVEFNSDASVLLAVLAGMNDAEHRVVVDGLNAKPARTEMTLTFWFDLSATEKP
ncbi:MAG: hypothetical protein DI603_22295 [Roseateles depolymerans]|uniref:General secretion pathway protein GspM n=1 Tax=Roseateles depolymerans TaxID=76731 RepID=A0A2W5DFW5_9BURK|nr:MAG: hypothetical protein DI603_22295 [Roseateles depolymerans]